VTQRTIVPGLPLVIIPGIQGRWEWMQPSVEALAREHRVITTSLPGEPGVGTSFNEDADFDVFVRHIDTLLDSAKVSDAIVCGVSFGGLIALRYAATRGDRVRGLILVSTPGPTWKLNPRLALYAKWPTLSSPLFLLGAVGRYWKELRVTYPDSRARLNACVKATWRVAKAPAIPHRMGRRARLAEKQDFEADCLKVKVPTLVVTGERDLDRVVPCDETMRYLSLIPGASFQLFERTGHLGTVLAPEQFAAIVSRFARNLDD
jgi:pimeloyl-ACP methyl ester carboxylesterase